MRIPLPLPLGTANGSMRLCSDAWYRASASSHSMTTTTQHSFERLVPVSIIHVGRLTCTCVRRRDFGLLSLICIHVAALREYTP